MIIETDQEKKGGKTVDMGERKTWGREKLESRRQRNKQWGEGGERERERERERVSDLKRENSLVIVKDFIVKIIFEKHSRSIELSDNIKVCKKTSALHAL